MANDNNSTNDSELEKKLNLDRLKIKYADVINSPAVQAICNWRDPLDYLPDSGVGMTDEEYAAKAEKSAPKFLELYNKANKLHSDNQYNR